MPQKKMKKLQTFNKAERESASLPPDISAEYDGMTIESLCEAIPLLKQNLEKSTQDRNYAQTERDTVERMAMATKDQLENIDAEVKLLSIHMEGADKQHRAECNNYSHKLKMLEREQAEKIKSLVANEKTLRLNESTRHEMNAQRSLGKKISLLEEVKEQELENHAKVQAQSAKDKNNLSRFASRCEENYRKVQVCSEQKLQKLSQDLEIERIVRLQELKIVTYYSHVNKLKSNHAKIRKEALEHHRRTTRESLALIKTLSAHEKALESEHRENAVLIEDLTRVQDIHAKSLQSAKHDVFLLEQKLKNRPRDLQYLRNAKARLSKLSSNLSTKQKEIADWNHEIDQMNQNQYDVR